MMVYVQEVEALHSKRSAGARPALLLLSVSSFIFSRPELNHSANISIARMFASSAGSLNVSEGVFGQAEALAALAANQDKSNRTQAAAPLQTGCVVKPGRCAASPADQTEAGRD